ncbi:MAG: hypothetical protein AAFO94_06220 [Bacteroidota bacterium]
MSKTEALKLPLFALFRQLQNYDIGLKHEALDHSNYLCLLDVLQEGYGWTSANDLYSICRTLWLKPHHNERQFRRYFDRHLKDILAKAELEKQQTSTDRSQGGNSGNTSSSNSNNDSKTDDETTINQKPEKEKDKEQAPNPQPKEAMEMVQLRFGSVASGGARVLPAEAGDWESKINEKIFRLRGKYFPLPARDMQQRLRTLRVAQDSQQDVYIDWEATIRQVAQKGYLVAPVYKSATKFTSDACLLIDHGGSMVAFRQLTAEITKAVNPNPKKASDKVFYFRNVPGRHLYKDPEQEHPYSVLQFKKQNHQAIFIVSDAGAARGRLNMERVESTLQFLKGLKPNAVIWLNPMPRFRWSGTTASIIADHLPMFEISELEFGNAVKALKGK